MAQNSNNADIDVTVETTKTIDAAVDNTGNISASLEPFAGDVARDCAEKAQKSAEAAAASEQAAKASETAAKDSETAAAGSASAAAASEANAKTSETKAGQSESNAKASADAAAASAQDAHNVAESIGNPVSDVSETNGRVTVTKADGAKNEFFAGLNMLQRNKGYSVGDIAYSPNLPSWAYLECITSGSTGAEEPNFDNVTGGGATGDEGVDVKDPITLLNEKLKALEDRVIELESSGTDEDSFAIVYPNGGTESSPATITIDTHYDIDNPFPGYYVYCMAQVYFNGKWGETGWIYNNGGYGTFAGQILPEDVIYVQTGAKAVVTLGKDAGNGMQTGQVVTSAPCRILVKRLGQI